MNTNGFLPGPIIQVRDFHDGTWSVMARVWNPQKEFYEHPKYINLPEKDARQRCEELLKNPPSTAEITENWVFIGS